MSAKSISNTITAALAETFDGRVDAPTDIVLSVLLAMIDREDDWGHPGEPSARDYADSVMGYLRRRYDV